MKIYELIKDLEAMQAEGMEEVQVLTHDSERLFPSTQRLDHVHLDRQEKAVLLVTEAAASANV